MSLLAVRVGMVGDVGANLFAHSIRTVSARGVRWRAFSVRMNSHLQRRSVDIDCAHERRRSASHRDVGSIGLLGVSAEPTNRGNI